MMQICFILLCLPLVLMIHLVRFRLVMIAAQAGTRPVVTAVRIGHHLTFNYYLRLCKYEDNKAMVKLPRYYMYQIDK